MFADRLIDWVANADLNLLQFEHGRAVRIAMETGASILEDEETQRFVLSPQVAELTADLIMKEKSFKKLAENVLMPDDQFWIEWSLDALGNVLADKYHEAVTTSVKKCGMVVKAIGLDELNTIDPHCAMVTTFVLTKEDHVGFGTAFVVQFQTGDIRYHTAPGYVEDNIPVFCRFLAAAIAVINTPRIFNREQSDLEKLNKSRIKKGKKPLGNYTEITMPSEVAAELQAGREAAKIIDPTTGKRKRHRVHTFARVKLGKVELVRPHWRGDAKLGYSDPTLRVKRAGETMEREGHARTIIR